MKQTYEQRVRALAEDFARINATALFELYDRTVGRAETVEAVARCAEQYKPFAYIAIKHMAAAVIQAWNDNEPVETSRSCEAYLKEQGLIPDDGQGLPKQIYYIPAATLREGGIDDITNNEARKESAFEKAIRETVERNNGVEAGKDDPY